MANDHDPHSKQRQSTVLGATGAEDTSSDDTVIDDDMGDTFMASSSSQVSRPPVARPVTSPPEARPPGSTAAPRPVTGPPEARPVTGPPAARPVTGPPAAAPPRSDTVLGASGAAPQAAPPAAPANTAPEIGGDHLGGVAGLEDLPHTNPEKWIGQVVAERYRILSMLGQGGMGVVYLAEHVVIEKKVALKVLNEELSHSRDVVSRFIGEAKAASRIGHDNIIDITDFGTTPDGGVFFVMEHLDGEDLSDRLKSLGRYPWATVRDVAVQICRGLAAAHSKGIIHRDLKPENVFLIKHAGRDDFVKILDFGIAKFTGLDGGEPKMTKTGVIFGTPDYMSPEQAEGKKADHRVDIYALGVILYELATGRLPFVAETFMGVLHQHMAKEPQPPRELCEDIPADFEAVILRALAKDPAARYQSMNEFAEALEAVTGEDAVAVAPAASAAAAAASAAPPTLEDAAIPAMRPQSNVATGKVPALSDAPVISPTAESAVELTASPVAAEAGGKKSMLPLILIIVVVTLALGAGAFFLMKQRGKGAGKSAPPPGGETAMKVVPPPQADAAAVAAMPPEMRPPPMPIYVTPEKITLTVAITNRRLRAKVYLDDTFLGKVPLKKKAIPYGTAERTLEIRARKHRTVQIKFTPDSNQSWERRLIRGRGTTHVVSMRPMRPMDAMTTMTTMTVMTPPMDVMRVAPMPPAMRDTGPMELKNPFAMSK